MRSFLLLTLLLLIPVAAFAEIIHGKAESADLEQNTLRVSRFDPDTGSPELVTITVSQATVFQGINNLSELHSGARVEIDAMSDENGAYHATSVELQNDVPSPSQVVP